MGHARTYTSIFKDSKILNVTRYGKEGFEGGDEKAQQCGWLKDQLGLSWQIVPTALGKLLGDKDPQKWGKVMSAMRQMKKIEIKALQQAYDG